MSEYDDYYWTRHEGVAPHRKLSFSLGTLLRCVTLICLALGWLALIRWTPPEAVQALFIVMAGVSAAVVGIRRHGRMLSRVLAAVWFFVSGLFIAVYSALAACLVQQTAEVNDSRWDGLGHSLGGAALVLTAPVVIAVLLFMARAWTWSAHDSSLYKRG